MSMEQNSSNHNLPPPPMLCRSGCGFYGSPSFEGMCSICFKDTLKRRQQNTSPTALLNQSAISAAVSESATSAKTSTSSSNSSNTTPETSSVKDSPTPGATATSPTPSTTPSVETASPTIPSATAASQDKEETEKGDKAQAETEGATVVKEPVSEESSPANEVKKPKKNKCHTCKKKVGLTGFQCRCGGLYCSMHRYSDKHDCQFDYKELAQQQIRKQNPVVVGQKVQKI